MSNLIILFIIFAVIYRYFVPALFISEETASKHTDTHYHTVHQHISKHSQPSSISSSSGSSNNNNDDVVLSGPFTDSRAAFLLPYLFVAPIFVFSY